MRPVHSGQEIIIDSPFVPHQLGKLGVMYKGREFFVIDSHGAEHPIARGDLCKELRGISPEHLEKMLVVGYISVRKIGEDYGLRFDGRLRGGGPILAGLIYVGMNVVGGALIVTGVGTAAGVAMVTAAPYTLIATLPAGPV